MKFMKYLAGRLLAWFMVIFIGITFMFFIPRFFPSDPVETMISQMLSRTSLPADEVASLRVHLRTLYGLDGTLWEQYVNFLKNAVQFDFGPSLMNFPTSAAQIVARYLPYTVGLSLFTTIIAWVLGNFIGLLAGFRKDKTSSVILEYIAIFLYPIPYFIVALVVQILFCFIWKIFPVTATIVTAQGTSAFLRSRGKDHARIRAAQLHHPSDFRLRHQSRRRLRRLADDGNHLPVSGRGQAAAKRHHGLGLQHDYGDGFHFHHLHFDRNAGGRPDLSADRPQNSILLRGGDRHEKSMEERSRSL